MVDNVVLPIHEDVFGCLSDQAMPREAARRKISDIRIDPDLLYFLLMSPFQIDALLKISLSKVFRRLEAKTQVIPSSENSHVRTRLSHSVEVATIALSIAKILGLNPWLAYAASLGHDIGHAPLGHDGEKFLAGKTNGTFSHNLFGVMLATQLERKGNGLNLTAQVLNSILLHGEDFTPSGFSKLPFPEAAIAQFADKIAFITADINDLQRFNFELVSDEFCEVLELLNGLGSDQRERVNKLVCALCEESYENHEVAFWDSEIALLFHKIRQKMWSIYPAIHTDYAAICERVYGFLENARGHIGDPVINFALMTDEDIFLLAGEPFLTVETLKRTSIWELIPYYRDQVFNADSIRIDF